MCCIICFAHVLLEPQLMHTFHNIYGESGGRVIKYDIMLHH